MCCLFACQNTHRDGVEEPLLFRMQFDFVASSGQRDDCARCDKNMLLKELEMKGEHNSSQQTCWFYCRQVRTREMLCDYYLDEHYLVPHENMINFHEILHTIEQYAMMLRYALWKW